MCRISVLMRPRWRSARCGMTVEARPAADVGGCRIRVSVLVSCCASPLVGNLAPRFKTRWLFLICYFMCIHYMPTVSKIAEFLFCLCCSHGNNVVRHRLDSPLLTQNNGSLLQNHVDRKAIAKKLHFNRNLSNATL